MVSKEHNIVQNKYNDLQKQVEIINDISATKLKNDKMANMDLYKGPKEQNDKLTSILRKNEDDLSKLNKKLEYTLNNINIHENELLQSKHKKAVLSKPKPTNIEQNELSRSTSVINKPKTRNTTKKCIVKKVKRC